MNFVDIKLIGPSSMTIPGLFSRAVKRGETVPRVPLELFEKHLKHQGVGQEGDDDHKPAWRVVNEYRESDRGEVAQRRAEASDDDGATVDTSESRQTTTKRARTTRPAAKKADAAH